MKTAFRKKLLKTIIYRLTASGLAQMLSWIFFRRIEVNAVVLIVDGIQMGYYFFFESIWSMSNGQTKALRKRTSRPTSLLKQKGFIARNVMQKKRQS